MYLTKLIAEDWAQLWPNVFAISFWTVLLFIWHHRNLKKHITSEHDKSRAHAEGLNGNSPGDPLPSEQEAP